MKKVSDSTLLSTILLILSNWDGIGGEDRRRAVTPSRHRTCSG